MNHKIFFYIITDDIFSLFIVLYNILVILSKLLLMIK